MRGPLNDAALDTLFRDARSFGRYTDRPVSEDQLHAIWELMKFGPTAANQLPARLVWCASDDAKAKLAACVSEANRPKVLGAPLTVIIGMDVEFHEHLREFYPHVDARAWYADSLPAREKSALLNSSLQAAYLIVAARALGLDVGPMGGFDAAAIDAAFFGDQPNVRVNIIATLGYGDRASLHDRLPRPAFERFNRIL
ncbi:malonic semialdehyde reductase [Sphingomonas sp. XXL09]|uniref:malonic semialdehyde reductase n=1 Tax=Sphingomonas sp. XXL09 TaxID=3457787 RepID=UPI00406BA7FF